MRSTFSALTALLAIASIVPALAHDAHDPAKRSFSHHKRVVNSRAAAAADKRDDSAAAALALINSTLASAAKASSPSAPSAGSVVKGAIAAGSAPPAENATTSSGLRFPDLGFQMPASPPASIDDWWTDLANEYAFMGFSYEVTACQSLSTLTKDFKNIRTKFSGRYVRLYGTCDKKGFYDDVVSAAWDATLGVHALVWFGFTGGNAWQTRLSTLLTSLTTNPKAPFVTRVIQFGSEPLFDDVLPATTLATQVTDLKAKLKKAGGNAAGVNVTVSDMAYGFQERAGQGSAKVLEAMDWVNAHMLPFFSTKATTGAAALPLVKTDLEWFMAQPGSKGKKIYMDENAWPSVQSSGVQANSKKAVASVSNEQAYFSLLDAQCPYFKATNGGIGWFVHIYSDAMEPGYGVYDDNGKMKWDFKARTSC